MGVTVHYRGRIRDLSLLPTFEDVVVDLALETDGLARVWRSAGRENPKRVVRGVMLDLAPGLETVSLLVSPEGWLIPLHEIEEAEKKPVTEAPWVFVKTQFGPPEAHVALCALLDALGKEYLDLEIVDDGGYWPKRDLAELKKRRGIIAAGIRAMTAGLRKAKIHPEDRDDPELLANHVERIAKQVHRLIARPPEHAPARFSEDEEGGDFDPGAYGTEEEWDAAFREERRKQERMHRAMEERTLGGEPAESAFEEAMRDEGILEDDAIADVAKEAEERGDSPEVREMKEATEEAMEEAAKDLEEGKAVLPDRRKRHPLLERMKRLTLRTMRLPEGENQSLGGILSQLDQGVLEMSGGLAQALVGFEDGEEEDEGSAGWNVVQLKRALRGAAFVLGAILPARAEKLIGEKDADFIEKEAEAIEREIRKRLQAERGRLRRKGRA